MTTALEIVTGALDEIAYRPPDDELGADEAAPALRTLNAMMRGWSRQGIIIAYPSGKTWRGRWRAATSYAVDDAVFLSGTVYVCTVAHTSPGPIEPTTRPGSSPDWASYWSRYAAADLALTDTVTLDTGLEDGVIAMLAERIAPGYGLAISPLTHQKAREGFDSLWAAYNPDTDQELDSGITTITTSIRRWW